MDKIRHHIEIEQKIIHLMLRYHEASQEMINDGLSEQFFDKVHQRLVSSIYYEHLNNRLLTSDGYRSVLLQDGHKEDLSVHMEVYAKCDIKAYASLDDLGFLKKQLVDAYASRMTIDHLQKFNNEAEKHGHYIAARNLIDELNSKLVIAESKRADFASVGDMKDEYLTYIKDRRDNPSKIITCGIPEIDESMPKGFSPQHLTLFVADVGVGKTAIMLNVAINLWKQGYSILFIPLEMSKLDLMDRIVSNLTGINLSKLSKPESLSDSELEQVEKANIWDSKTNKFCILDANERTSVSVLKHEIQKRVFVFKPQVVFIDYIANLKPDIRFGNRNDLEIGEILKDLCFLGKKFEFSIVSAAQLGRSAIRALKEGKSETPDSSAIRGSHEYSADATNIFVLLKPKAEESDTISLYTLKSRYGPSGQTEQLRADHKKCLITSFKKTLGLTDTAELSEEINQDVSHQIQAASLDFDGDIELGENDSKSFDKIDDDILGIG